jgi:hypothetical protein
MSYFYHGSIANELKVHNFWSYVFPCTLPGFKFLVKKKDYFKSVSLSLQKEG